MDSPVISILLILPLPSAIPNHFLPNPIKPLISCSPLSIDSVQTHLSMNYILVFPSPIAAAYISISTNPIPEDNRLSDYLRN